MKRITALPIKGESYLLEYFGKKILVDGGYSSSTLVPALKKQLGASNVHLDVVVCTHSDNDHAGGLTDLLDQDGITASEFWLPGSWNDVIKDLVEETELFYQELVEEVRQHDGERLNDLSSEENQQVDRWLAVFSSNVTLSEHLEAPKEGRKLRLRPSNQIGKTTAAIKAKRSITMLGKSPCISRRAIALIDTAERIRKIALSAYAKGVPVRWFDYLAYSKDRTATGGEVYLRPINAKELLEPPSLSPLEFRRFITLSRANRESLVFLSSGDDAHVEVLFCGDSPLGDGPGYGDSFLAGQQTHKPLIATAPHHGSDSNAMAYGHIKKFGQVAFWIRAGGKPEHPESAFRGISAEFRTCTHCPHKKLPLQSVCITDKCETFCDPEAWLTVRSHDCVC